MASLSRIRQLLLGAPLDPLSPTIRQHIALAAFIAWVGLGADGLSSSAYGPEEAFKALGTHAHLGLYLAVATAFTVFIISLAYNQVIELFPTGGGYRVCVSKRKRPKEGGADPTCWRLRGKSSNRQGTWQRALLRIGCEYRSRSFYP